MVPVTLVQSIGDHLNVGGAVKGVWSEGIDGRTHGRLDADLGVMVRTDAWRVGLVLRNLAEPTFGPEVIAFGGNRYRLERHARLGVAVFPRDGLTLAADADLMPLETADGRRRAIAVGVEQRAGSRVVLRGGVRAQTIDDARPSASGGASVAITTLIWADVQATGGSDRADRSWTVGLRAQVLSWRRSPQERRGRPPGVPAARTFAGRLRRVPRASRARGATRSRTAHRSRNPHFKLRHARRRVRGGTRAR